MSRLFKVPGLLFNPLPERGISGRALPLDGGRDVTAVTPDHNQGGLGPCHRRVDVLPVFHETVGHEIDDRRHFRTLEFVNGARPRMLGFADFEEMLLLNTDSLVAKVLQ